MEVEANEKSTNFNAETIKYGIRSEFSLPQLRTIIRRIYHKR